ncbi:tetratricopeptide repeat protein [Confluentibacter lentus]|uniref:tetratricopeptide repeat protein n=1 Tax=Confluentibacter lentus TaxID=1699412 RepID=UPI000C289E9E|nr:tetratricopeptide repeat protein [Confluentibacter lentus]
MKTKAFYITFLISLILLLSSGAQTNPDLYDMPTAENVLKNIKGTSAIDTYAKHRAALYVLWDIAMFEIDKDYLHKNKPIEKVISAQKQEYNNAMRLVYEKYLKEINQEETQEVKDKWQKLWANYKFHTVRFKEDLIATLFNQTAKKRYYDINGYPELKEIDLTDADAVYQAGKKYFYGEDVNKSLETAFTYFKRAAEMGHPDGQYAIGYMYATGSYITQDYNEALTWFKKAEIQENAKALVYLGHLYQNGLGITKDDNKAFEYLQKAAGLNDPDGQFNLGLMFANGVGTDKNEVEALKYFNLAANNNNASALNQLGHMYENGIFVSKDINKAFNYYLKAAKQDNADSQFKIGIFYGDGKVVEQNCTIAEEWFKKSADKNHFKSLQMLAEMYFKGICVKENYKTAFNYYLKVAQFGGDEDQYRIGYWYYRGIGTDVNYNEAFKWWSKAADQNNPTAIIYIGFLYINGLGVIKDNAKGLSYFNKAKSLYKDIAKFYYNVGVIYHDQKNHTEAINYYKEALIINPLYEDANLNMASLILDEDAKIVNEMNALGTSKEDDIQHKELKKKREFLFKMVIPYLQRIIETNGDFKSSAIDRLLNIYSYLGDTENEAKMKKLLD